MAVLWEEKFAGGVLTRMDSVGLDGSASNLLAVTDRVRLAGGYAMRCTAGGTGGFGGATRAEFGYTYQILDDGIAQGDRPGDTVWYGWSHYIPATFVSPSQVAVLFQWFNVKPAHGNGFAIAIDGAHATGTPNFGAIWGLASGNFDGVNYEYITSPGFYTGLDANPSFYNPATGWATDIWWDFKLKIGCSTSWTGSVELWAKPSSTGTWAKILTRTNIPTMEIVGADTEPVYGVISGLYQPGYTGTNQIWQGGVVRAESGPSVDSWFTGAASTIVTLTSTRQAASDWRTLICDRNGLPISNITRHARNREFKFRLNRPDSYSFEVPSHVREVADPWTDNKPYIETGIRTIKAFRRETGSDGVDRYVLRFAGTIETVEDNGTADDAKTNVVAFSPFYTLNKRLCRDAAGSPARVTFDNTSGIDIVSTLLSRTAAFGTPGAVFAGALSSLASDSTGAPWTAGIGNFTVVYQWQSIASAIVSLTDAFNGFDILWYPVDRTDGVLAQAVVTPRAGSTHPHVVLGWGIAPHNVESIRNFVDRGTLANAIWGLGPDSTAQGPVFDTPSVNTYGQLEDVEQLSDVNTAMVTPLITEALSFRKRPRQIVNVTPASSFPWQPFKDFDLGDMISVWAGLRLRGGLSGVQRVYGFDLSLNNEAVERIAAIYTSAEA